jgi:hypothetical protein
MPTKLKNLKIKRVALVDEGANPDAHIRFAKSKDAPPDSTDMTADEALSIMDRLVAFVHKAFSGGAAVEKAAYTFAEGEVKRDYDGIMRDEVWPMVYALTDSVYSIFCDVQKSDDEKAALLKQSVSEFSDAFGSAAQSWASGKNAQTDIQKGDEALVKMRDHLTALIEEGTTGDDAPTADGASAPVGEEEPTVKKGATDMFFDTSKMTPEERATYEDFAKRFGSEEAPGEAEDMYKGLHPAVKAELENLRKFREDAENREFLDVAKRYELLGKKPEELAPVLKSLKNAGGSAYSDMIGVLDASLDAIEKSGTFSEIGKRGESAVDGAWGKIEAAAQEIMKGKPDMRYADAIDAACIAHPELVQEYEKSRR